MKTVQTAARAAWDTIRGGLAFVVLFFFVAPVLSVACYLGLLDIGDDERPETMGPEGDDVW